MLGRPTDPYSQLTELSTDGFALGRGRLPRDEWNAIVNLFDDGNLTQTWSYGEARWAPNNLSHTVLTKDGEIVAAAQAVIKKVPLLGSGLAYIKSGPLWKARGIKTDVENFREMLRALREFYVGECGLLLRIFPVDTEDGSGIIRSIFEEEGFERDVSLGTPKTACLDLGYSLCELRNSLKRPWAQNLSQAEKNDLTLRHGISEELFEIFARLYAEMLRRKRITGVVDIGCYRETQRALPDPWKMRIMICEHRGKPIAGIVVPFFGNTAHNLLAATGDSAGNLRGAYLLQWRMIEWLKEHGCRWYDLDGVNRAAYPGVSQFKMGLAGRLGREAEYAGLFESCASPISQFCVKAGDYLLKTYKETKAAIYGATNR